MRILIVPSWYPTPSRPINGVFVRDQADMLHQAHDVRVLYLDVLPRGARTTPRSWTSAERGYVEQIVQVRNRPLIWQFAYLWHMYRVLLDIRKEFRPDLIHCHVAVPAGWAATVLSHLFRTPVVLTEHSSEFQSWLKRPGLRMMAQWAFRSASLVIAVSQGQKQRLQQSFHRRGALVVVPNMVDTDRFVPTPLPPSNEGYRLLFVGLLDTDQKGVHVLLAALALLRQQTTLDVRCDLVGDGRLRAEYEAQARQLGISSMVRFHGLKPHAAVAQMLQQSHALVLPSLHEAAPMVIIEALASGRPVISTRCGGPEFMLDEATGLIVEPGDSRELAQAIAYLLSHIDQYDPDYIAVSAVMRYGKAEVTSSLTDVYRAVLRDSSPKPNL